VAIVTGAAVRTLRISKFDCADGSSPAWAKLLPPILHRKGGSLHYSTSTAKKEKLWKHPSDRTQNFGRQMLRYTSLRHEPSHAYSEHGVGLTLCLQTLELLTRARYIFWTIGISTRRFFVCFALRSVVADFGDEVYHQRRIWNAPMSIIRVWCMEHSWRFIS
jgi:hypothetical protein